MNYVFIVTNSPGELVGWVKPLVGSLKKKTSGIKIVVVITPCQYASGMEKEVAESFPEVDYVMSKGEYFKYLFLNLKPPELHLSASRRGVVLFLGGDPLYALFLSKRLGFPAMAYTHRLRYKRFFKRFMVLNNKIREKFIEKGARSEKVVVVGDLVKDAVQPLVSKEKLSQFLHINPDSLSVSIFPGSRPWIVRYMTPLFLRVCELIKEKFPKIQFFLILSPFVGKEELTNLTKDKLSKVFPVNPAKLKKEEDQWKLITESGLKVLVIKENQYEVMSMSTIAITIPGTNTGELSFLGVPMVVTVPLNKPEAIPLDGLPGLIGSVPLVGTSIKRLIVRKYNKNVKFTAAPNRYAGKKIVPEVRGVVQAEDVAKEAIELLKDTDSLHRISAQLKELFPPHNSSDKLAEIILNKLR
ncbi:MAG: hypothetical protein U9O41_07565 [Candidatus Aerophobetes bacterium]|nr:hypothetical protein [Candidatus Aerophobetes bacterium]